MRILICSDAPWANSGYAVQVRHLAPRLRDRGHAIALLTTFGLHGGQIDWQGIPCYPGGADPFGNDVIPDAARAFRPDIIITLKDVFVFHPQAFAGFRWCPMVPVDHDPPPPGVIEAARASYRPIAYAPNGVRALHDAGLDPLYASHAYDPAILAPMDRAEARVALGIPAELFVVGTVAVNRGGIPSRKALPQNLEAFAQFAADKPDVRYFLHTYLGQDGAEGSINLAALCGQLGILDKVLFCDQDRYRAGFPDDYMRALYSSLDVLNAVSLGEGFGVPMLEAQAVGIPVIAGNWAAQADLLFSGWSIAKADALAFYSAQGAYQYIPQPAAVARALTSAYTVLRDPQTAALYRERALTGAAPYAIDRVLADYWDSLLAELTAQIGRETSRGVLRIVRPAEVLA